MKFTVGLSLGLLILCTSTFGLAQSTPDANTETGKPINGLKEGVWKSYYPHSTTIHYQGSYHRGKRVGLWIWRYRNGSIKETQEYKNGLKHGTWFEYFLNGNVKSQGHFDQAVRDGKWSIRDKASNLVRKGSYYNGVFEGKIYKYPTKNEKVTIHYSDNEIFTQIYDTPNSKRYTFHHTDNIGKPKYMAKGLTATITFTKSNNRLVVTKICHHLNGLRHGTCFKRTVQKKIIGHGFFNKGKYVKDIDTMNPKEDGIFDRAIRNKLTKEKIQYAIPNTNQFKPKTVTTNKP